MKLSDLIIAYRNEHGLSQRQFSAICGVSNGYISMIENGVNPKTGQPVVPSVQQYQKIAVGMGMSLQDLFSAIDDAPVDIGKANQPASVSGDELTAEFAELFSRLTPEQRKLIISQIKGILASQ